MPLLLLLLLLLLLIVVLVVVKLMERGVAELGDALMWILRNAVPGVLGGTATAGTDGGFGVRKGSPVGTGAEQRAHKNAAG